MANSARRDGRKASTAERQAEALKLRREGLSYEAIGQRLGITKQSVGALVKRAIEAIPREEAKLVLALELSRLDEMLHALSARARRGEPEAVDRMLKIMARRSRYLGLDAPDRSEISGPDAGPIAVTTEAPARLRSLLDRLTPEEPTGSGSDPPSSDG